MNKDTIYPLWPIKVGQFHNPDHQIIKKDLVKFFQNYENENNTSRVGVENHNLYESKYNLHLEKNDALSKVLIFMAKSFMSMAQNINKAELNKIKNKNPKLKVKIKDSWFIRYKKEGAVMPHDHGNCSMSCVYYFQIDDNSNDLNNGSTYFMRPYNRGSSHNDFGGLNYVNGGINTFEAVEGSLLIWPSFLMHGSKPYLGEKNRIVISANADIDIVK